MREVLVLDVGSGTNRSSIARGNVCIDLCKRPGNRPPVFICADAHHLPFRDAIFDKVCTYEVIEHVESPIQCLREMRRVLREKGLLELTTPNVFHWRTILRQARGLPTVLSDTGHISAWSQAELQNVLVNAGFSAARFKYVTLPLVVGPHERLDRAARLLLPDPISQRNMVVTALKKEINS